MSDDSLPSAGAQCYARCLERIAFADAARPFVVAQLGQTLDGRIALPNGESRWINNEAALDHLHRLRAAVDAVVVGVGTVLADNPQLNVRRVAGRNPARVVIDPGGRMPVDAALLTEDGARRIQVTRTGVRAASAVEQIALKPGAGGMLAPEHIVAALHARGLRRLLIEGGATTVSAFMDARVVDRLHLLVAPCILGTGKTGINLNPIPSLGAAMRPPAHVHVLDGGDVLFDCDMERDRSP
ncbi:MAG: RibD family protein [Hyphomicrobiaceae bacterium]|nr:RibD family protein [Hyphomicrobiaceae bacterium]